VVTLLYRDAAGFHVNQNAELAISKIDDDVIAEANWIQFIRDLWANNLSVLVRVLGYFTLVLNANAQVKTETKVEEGLASQTIKVETGEVVYVSGNDLIVKTDDGGLRHFPNVPDDKTVTVAGKQLTIHDLKPGMHLQRTTITTTTPRMITTVWHINPPNSVILTPALFFCSWFFG
jgi:hypothetical protein